LTGRPFVVWWWPVGLAEAEFDVPVPYERTFEDVGSAVAFAGRVSVDGVEWVRCFGPTELDEHYRWKAAA